MGKPSPLTDAEREHLTVFARAVVRATDRDEEQPTPTWPDGDAMDESTMIFKLCQWVLDHQPSTDDDGKSRLQERAP